MIIRKTNLAINSMDKDSSLSQWPWSFLALVSLSKQCSEIVTANRSLPIWVTQQQAIAMRHSFSTANDFQSRPIINEEKKYI